MDSESAVGQSSRMIEQAVFTSVRSPMGEGYRVVAASGGVDVDHKREITRRSPSHDSMCMKDQDARATSVYPLPDGRVCVSLSGHAGKEHTGRGGLRVYTHVAVLDEKTYSLFGCSPVAVEHALAGVIGERFDPKPPKNIDAIQLPCTTAVLPVVPSSTDAQRVAVIAAAIIEGRRVVVSNTRNAREVLNWIMMALPCGSRRSIAFSAGLKVSPARDFQLVIVEGDAGKRVPEGYCIMNWEQPPQMLATPFRAWFEFVQREWSGGRGCDLRDLTHRIATKDAQVLAAIARVCDDFAAVSTATADELMAMSGRHPRSTPHGGVYRDLVAQLHEAIATRGKVLAAAADADARGVERSQLS